MTPFSPPTLASVSPANPALSAQLSKTLGKVPNLYAALAQRVHDIAIRRSPADAAGVETFAAAGSTPGNLIDAIVVIGDKTVTHALHGVTRVPVDVPTAPALDA